MDWLMEKFTTDAKESMGYYRFHSCIVCLTFMYFQKCMHVRNIWMYYSGADPGVWAKGTGPPLKFNF